MSKTVAVLTDATSAEFWFPKWHDYYERACGSRNLYVVTYEGRRHAFDPFELGGVSDVPHVYSDARRVQVIAALGRNSLWLISGGSVRARGGN